jgi:ribosome-associated heat shock protein Hsp15
VNGRPAKPATSVAPGDRVEVVVRGEQRVLEVVRPIEKRVGAAVAAECFIDHSPPRPPRERVDPLFVRDRAAGRPTKRERRQLDRFRQR